MQTFAFRRPMHTVISWACPLVLLGAAASVHADQTTPAAGSAAEGGIVHTMSEFDFLIGTWRCLTTQTGKPDTRSDVKYEWLYDRKVLRETVTAPGYAGEFMTTLDKKSNTFKGVAVGSSGTYIVWENSGMKDNKSSEVGYRFANGQLIAVSRSDFERLSDTHYIFRDFGPDTPSGKGPPKDAEDCNKTP